MQYWSNHVITSSQTHSLNSRRNTCHKDIKVIISMQICITLHNMQIETDNRLLDSIIFESLQTSVYGTHIVVQNLYILVIFWIITHLISKHSHTSYKARKSLFFKRGECCIMSMELMASIHTNTISRIYKTIQILSITQILLTEKSILAT